MDQEVLIKAEADEVTVITPSVTDAELDAAAAGKTLEEKPVEEKPAEELKPEKTAAEIAAEEEHRERSRLGRKLAKVEEELLEQRKQTNELMELLRTQMPRKEEDKPNIPEYITTPQELEQYLEYRDQTKMKKQQEYHGLYRKTVFGFKVNDNAEIHAEILKEMDANFNTIPTGNPIIDAELNYNKAARAYYAKLAATKKVEKQIPLKGGESEVPTGLSGTSRVNAKEAALPKLDSVAQEYVDYLRSKGKKEEEITAFVKSTLEGEAPAYIGQR
uniref:Uncharacterized protein n=1 Tax=viral metagenome TaxID=1070528 RepID=A0A6M3KZ82_9ZZZZ